MKLLDSAAAIADELSAILAMANGEAGKCSHCHAGPFFTDMQQHNMENKGKYDKQTIWDTPMLIEIWRSAP